MNAADTIDVIHAHERPPQRPLRPRLVRAGIALAILLHALAIYLIIVRITDEPEPPEPAPRADTRAPVPQAKPSEDVGVASPVELGLTPSGPTRRVTVPVTPPAPPVVPPAAETKPAEPGAAVATPDPMTSLDRLRYRSSETNLWQRSEPPPAAVATTPPMTPDEVVRSRVATTITAYNDSMAAAADAAARATDWTVKDADGNRWGVSPGKIHLGGLTLPLPFQLSTPPGRRDEVAGRVATWNAIQQQSAYVEGREVVKDRVKAIEKRKAAERAARQGTTTSGGTTTGGGTSGGGGGGS